MSVNAQSSKNCVVDVVVVVVVRFLSAHTNNNTSTPNSHKAVITNNLNNRNGLKVTNNKPNKSNTGEKKPYETFNLKCIEKP